jgi:type I restriction enzyme, S subunit
MRNETTNTAVPKLRFPEFRETGDWEEKSFGEIAPLQRGFDLPTYELKPGKIPVVFSNGIQKFHSEGRAIAPGIVTGRSGTIGKIHFIKEGEYWPHNTSLWVTSFNGKDPEFIYFLYKSVGTERFASGSGVPTLNRNDVHAFKTFIPLTLPEQQKIAATLSSLDDLLTAHSAKLAALQAHKRGLMQGLFPAEGKTVPKLRFPEFLEAGEWEVSTLNELASFRRGSFPQPYGLPEWYDDVNGTPFIQVFDVDDNFLLKPKTKNKISKLASKQSVFIPKETVIVTLQGSIGRVAITQYDAYIDRTLLLFEKFSIPMDKVFFSYVLFLLFEIEKESAPGGIIKTITKEVLSDFKLSIPAIEEQKKIADCLSSLDNRITAQTQQIEALKLHKKGLMQGLFPAATEPTA